MSIRVLDPTARESHAAMQDTPRLVSLAGRTVGLLDNGKIRVRELLGYIENMLCSQYGVARIVHLRKPDASRPAPPEVVAEMQQCDALISAVGD